jgi:hypothetical protein
MKFWHLCIVFLLSMPVGAQNLMEERIWKLSSTKRSIYLDSGIFRFDSKIPSSITAIRSSIEKGRGYERLVLEFSTPTVPKIYGHISPHDKKVRVDLFATTITTSKPQLANSKHVKSIDFINVDGKSLTMEISMKDKASFDVFYLTDKGRLVIDIR